VCVGSSNGGTGSGTLNGSGSFALLDNSVPVDPSPEREHEDAPKGTASASPPASPSLKNSLREMSTKDHRFLLVTASHARLAVYWLSQKISNAFTGCRAAAGTAALARAYCMPIRARSPRGSSLSLHDNRPK
jgi:hypothetical protein